MKKFIQTALVFILLNTASHIFTSNIITSQTEGTSQNEAQIRGQNDFRRKILEFLTREYRSSLKEYFSNWQDSKQVINRELIEELFRIAEKDTKYDGGRYLYTMSISQEVLNDILRTEMQNRQDTAEEFYQRYLKNNDIVDLLQSIDLLLWYPNESIKTKMDILIDVLHKSRIDYPTQYLVYKENEINIEFNALLGFVINISFENQRVEKIADRNNSLMLKVGFPGNSPDITINNPSGKNETFLVKYNLNVERTFRISRFTHHQFFNAIINAHLNTAGEINIFYIANSIFYIRSENFSIGMSRAHDILRQKNWEIGNEKNYTHILEISKTINEERRLNIGSYYVKAHLEMKIFDNNKNLLQASRTKDFEAVDSFSFENSHNKLDRLLLGEIHRLF